ncbi:translation initiation factor IF-2-like [Panicum virgatum]|uniref:translation initiation factor IF-2-like n=1 Tax=Panicum virgatum TaxID=38727 RepID=UPI0019D635F3|nr:translation initiation factor IF-2-like [Panicum virgatum]
MDPLPLTPGPPGAFPAPTEPSSLSTRTPTATPRSWNSAMKQKRTGTGTREGPPAGDTQDAPSAAGDVAAARGDSAACPHRSPPAAGAPGIGRLRRHDDPAGAGRHFRCSFSLHPAAAACCQSDSSIQQGQAPRAGPTPLSAPLPLPPPLTPEPSPAQPDTPSPHSLPLVTLAPVHASTVRRRRGTPASGRGSGGSARHSVWAGKGQAARAEPERPAGSVGGACHGAGGSGRPGPEHRAEQAWAGGHQAAGCGSAAGAWRSTSEKTKPPGRAAPPSAVHRAAKQISQSQFDPHLCFPSAAAAAATSASLLLPGLHLHLLLEELAIARHRRPRGLHLGARLQPPCLSLRRHAASPSLPQGAVTKATPVTGGCGNTTPVQGISNKNVWEFSITRKFQGVDEIIGCMPMLNTGSASERRSVCASLTKRG